MAQRFEIEPLRVELVGALNRRARLPGPKIASPVESKSVMSVVCLPPRRGPGRHVSDLRHIVLRQRAGLDDVDEVVV